MTTTRNGQTSVGVFDDIKQAERTMDELRRHGFQAEEIGIIGHVGDANQPVQTPVGMKAPEGNVTRGISAGAIIGALIGALVILVIPGLGWVTDMGRAFEIVGGVILGAAAGGFLFAVGSLWTSRVPGRIYESELEQGRFIVTVRNKNRQQEALEVLRHSAQHVASDRA